MLAELSVHKTVTLSANLHCLIKILPSFSLHILLSVNSKKYQSSICSTEGLFALTEYQQVG